ncbi:hypothetical protein VQ056_15465 [Paenibacillus sp. JTLBN-2024]
MKEAGFGDVDCMYKNLEFAAFFMAKNIRTSHSKAILFRMAFMQIGFQVHVHVQVKNHGSTGTLLVLKSWKNHVL